MNPTIVTPIMASRKKYVFGSNPASLDGVDEFNGTPKAGEIVFKTVGTYSIDVLASGKVDVLVVAGGGATGRGSGSSSKRNPGAGGAGGLIFREGLAVSKGVITVTVGDGGAPGATENPGNNGDDSAFGSLVAKGGGAGGGHYVRDGLDGGSGGGAGVYESTLGSGGDGIQPDQSGDSGTYGFGNDGCGSSTNTAGGGGGAGGPSTGTAGGPGMEVWGTTYAKGGDAHVTGAAGEANTGNGGNATASTTTGYAGGSGIVIVRWGGYVA